MTRTVTDCDQCGKREVTATRLYIQVGWQTGGPGGSEEEQEIRDLCPTCAATVTNQIIGAMTMDERIKLAAKLKRPKGWV